MKKVLIKCGGSTLADLSADFFMSLQELKRQGYAIIIVHGGGPDIDEMLHTLKIAPKFEHGLRKTTAETLAIVEMVLAGKTNRTLVQKLTDYGLQALGLNGSDAGLLTGSYVNKEALGFVGDIVAVNVDFIQLFLEKGLIPVITPIALAADGSKLNVNADYAAAAIANALHVDHCLFVTDVEGIMINGKIQTALQLPEVEHYIKTGEIYGGMLPKVRSAIAALQKGISSVRIIAGKKGLFHNDEWNGTKIVKEESVIV